MQEKPQNKTKHVEQYSTLWGLHWCSGQLYKKVIKLIVDLINQNLVSLSPLGQLFRLYAKTFRLTHLKIVSQSFPKSRKL